MRPGLMQLMPMRFDEPIWRYEYPARAYFKKTHNVDYVKYDNQALGRFRMPM